MTDSAPDTPAAAPAAEPAKTGGKPAANKRRPPLPRQPNPVLERLFELYPKMFGARFLPLKLGVYQELLALHPDEFKKEDLKLALGQHARSTRYLEAVAASRQRYDLNAQAVEELAPEHIHHAVLEVYRRRQARSKQDLRPWLIDRVVDAMQASGLSREDYAERVRTQDEWTNGVLEEAMARLGEQAARREALRRAFQASGKTVAEFAEMYGMAESAVNAAIAP
jgi:ProP effector